MIRIKTLCLSVIMIAALILVSCQPAPSKDPFKKAEQQMKAYVDDGKLSGISVLTLKDGRILHQECFGLANIDEERALEKNSIFRIYSMSKPITAVALMMLYDEGKFQLDDPVDKYISGFKDTKVWVAGKAVDQQTPFTIRHLLTHTAGFTYGWGSSHVDSLYNTAYQGGIWATRNLENFITVIAGIPLKYQPGLKWEYSVSIDVAGYLVEVLSGMSFDAFLKTRLFDPLKMVDTGFDVPEKDFDRLAMIYKQENDRGKLTAVEGLTRDVMKKASIMSGGGGLVSTIGDYGRFGQMLLNGGELDGVRVLKETTVKMIMSDQMPSTCSFGKGMGYGLGGQVNLSTGVYSWSGMASTDFVADPKNNMVFLAFTQYVPNQKYKFAREYREEMRKALEE